MAGAPPAAGPARLAQAYLDPPYLAPPSGRTFRYQPAPFGFAEHQRLAALARELHRRGC